MRKLVLIPLILIVAACATVPPPAPAPAPAPAPVATAPVAPPPAAPSDKLEMSLQRAQQIVSDFERFEKALAWEGPDEALRQPQTTDDVLEILRRDQIDLFGVGVEFAAKQNDAKAKGLQAQIELAWGDAQMVLADLFTNLASHQRKETQRLKALESAGDLAPVQAQRLQALRTSTAAYTEMSEALYRLAEDHIAAGQRVARDIISRDPEDYIGYRLAADYYRLRGDWKQFDEMIAKLTTANPNSNGLLFQKAMDAIDRKGDTAHGAELLRKALAKDPKFIRAQAALVLTAETLQDRNAELDTLQRMNPHHQIVLWLGPQIKGAYLDSAGDGGDISGVSSVAAPVPTAPAPSAPASDAPAAKP